MTFREFEQLQKDMTTEKTALEQTLQSLKAQLDNKELEKKQQQAEVFTTW